MLLPTESPSAPHALDIRPARLSEMYDILALQRDAFSDKFGAAFGRDGVARGVEAMAEAWRRQGVFAMRGMHVAVLGDQIIGTITLRTWEMGGDETGAAELAFHQVLGPWGAIRSIFALSLLDHAISRDEGYVTDVAVLAAHRRQGVARAMLGYVEAEARIRRKRHLSLYVSGSNRGAQRLYEHHGFVRRRTRRSLWAGVLLRQSAWIFMQKLL